MVPTGNLASTGGTEEPSKQIAKPTDKTDTAFRPVTPLARDDRKGQKFKEVLDKKLSEDTEETSAVSSTGDEEEGAESISPLTLAALAPVKKVKNVKDALNTPTFEVEEPVEVEPDASKPKKIDVTVVAQNAPGNVLETIETTVKQPIEEEKPVVKAAFVPVEKNVDDGKKSDGKAVVKPQDVSSKPVVTEAVKEKIVEHARPAAVDLPKEKAAVVDADKDEEPLVAQVNLAATPQQQVNSLATAAVQKAPDEPGKAREVFIKLATEMIERLERITTPDQTDTTIKLQYPPLFSGAELVVTEYKIAQRQFNITFSGLSPDAQALIAMQQNQGELRQALIDKGYTLQTITIKPDIPGLQSLATGETGAEKREKGQKQTQGDDAGALR